MKNEENQKLWEGLSRGQAMAATTDKFVSYIGLADQKAQALIILNSILIPIALNWIDEENFHIPAVISIITSMISIMVSIIAIYPKRGARRVAENKINYLHFGDIGRLDEQRFMDSFRPLLNSTDKMAEAMAKDLYDMGKNVMLPKFFWLKIAYISFFVGNALAIIWHFLASLI